MKNNSQPQYIIAPTAIADLDEITDYFAESNTSPQAERVVIPSFGKTIGDAIAASQRTRSRG